MAFTPPASQSVWATSTVSLDSTLREMRPTVLFSSWFLRLVSKTGINFSFALREFKTGSDGLGDKEEL